MSARTMLSRSLRRALRFLFRTRTRAIVCLLILGLAVALADVVLLQCFATQCPP